MVITSGSRSLEGGQTMSLAGMAGFLTPALASITVWVALITNGRLLGRPHT
jgi:hypothetical protein